MLVCPGYSEHPEERAEAWRESVRDYIESDALTELLRLFGFRGTQRDLGGKIGEITAFADSRWDYRGRIGGKERWEIRDGDPVAEAHRETILACAEALGMIGVKSSRMDADYILPLGGARSANLDRVREAKRLLLQNKKPAPVIALSAMRPVSGIEIPLIREYVPGAAAGETTEFDVMLGAMNRVFPGTSEEPVGEGSAEAGPDSGGADGSGGDPNPNLRWEIRRCGVNAVLSAPSSRPEERRANTLDTLRFFCRKYTPPKGAVLMLTTSAIYINYQTAALVPFALEQGLELVFSGSSAPGEYSDVITNYLQETKGTLDAIDGFRRSTCSPALW